MSMNHDATIEQTVYDLSIPMVYRGSDGNVIQHGFSTFQSGIRLRENGVSHLDITHDDIQRSLLLKCPTISARKATIRAAVMSEGVV